MLPIIIIAFREFLEAFLIIGVFLGISRKLNIHKDYQIGISALLAFTATGFLSPLFFHLGSAFHFSELTIAILSIVSAIFIPLTVFSLHEITSKFTHNRLAQVKSQIITNRDWNTYIPLVIFFLVFKEGMEAVFFNLSNSVLNKDLITTMVGFLLGMVAAGICGGIISRFYSKLPIKKLYKISEVFIIFIGVNALTDGLNALASNYHFSLDSYSLLIDLAYIMLIYAIFIKEKTISVN